MQVAIRATRPPENSKVKNDKKIMSTTGIVRKLVKIAFIIDMY